MALKELPTGVKPESLLRLFPLHDDKTSIAVTNCYGRQEPSSEATQRRIILKIENALFEQDCLSES